MTGWLIKHWIKNPDDIKNAEVRRQYGSLCSMLGIMLNMVLFLGKYIAGVLSGSIAVMADAFNNLSDAGSSLITLIGFKLAGKKPDKEHPFGHGRMEYLSGLAVAAAIVLMGVELAKSSVDKIFHPAEVETGLLSVGILLASVAVKFYMSSYNKGIGDRIDSAAMRATAADSLSDAAATSVVLLTLLIQRATGFNVDGFCGILVAGFILYAGYNAAKDTLSPLLGQPPEPEFIEEIHRIALAHPEIIGIHDLVVHDYGPGRRMISLHGEVPGDGDIFALHDVIDQAEKELKDQLGCDAVIHMDPIEMDNHTVTEMRGETAKLAAELHPEITIHDFRMVTGPTHTNLIFDVVVPYSLALSDQEVTAKLQQKISERWENCFAIISIDHAYVL